MWLFGCASCARMNSASRPALKKKKNAVTMYRMPMRLWSTVVKKPGIPGASSHTPSTTSSVTGTTGSGSCSVVISIEALEVADDGLRLRRGQVDARHQHTRLRGGRVGDPL